MATSSFLQFNPTQANQETDTAYAADATRLGGAIDGNEWPSLSANKTLYQASTAIAALMQMMANKGFTVSDAALSTLTVQLTNILTTADLLSNLQSVSWASSLTLNAARYNGFEITLAGLTTLAISGQAVGQVIVLLFVQDGTGGHTITYPGNIIGAQPDPTPGVLSGQIFKVDAVGTLRALGPMVSINGMGGLALGNFSPADVNASTLRVAGAAPLGQVLTGDGAHYVPQSAPGFTSGSNANGYWQKDPSGLIRQWGHVSGLSTGSPQTVYFPIEFTNLSSVSVVATDDFAVGSSIQVSVIYGSAHGGSSPTLTQFQIWVSSSGNGSWWNSVGY
jgi:hypothetical protein